MYWRVRRRKFWSLLAWGTVAAGLAAVATELVAVWIPGAAMGAPFTLMQGQRTLMVIAIAAFATLFGHATIHLFFILPIQARWFLWIEILFAFMGFLGTRDLAGFVGLCAAVGVTNRALSSQRLARSLREVWLRIEHRRIRWKLERMRRRRGMRLVKGGGKLRTGGRRRAAPSRALGPLTRTDVSARRQPIPQPGADGFDLGHRDLVADRELLPLGGRPSLTRAS